MFDDKAITNTIGKGASAVSEVTSKCNVISSAIHDITNMVNVINQEQTKIEYIRAQRDIIIEQSRLFQKTMSSVLKDTHSERMLQINKYFKSLDSAIDKDNPEVVMAILTNMIELVRSGPLKDLVNVMETQRALQDKNQVWEY